MFLRIFYLMTSYSFIALLSLVDMTFVSDFFGVMGADKTPAAVWGAIQAAVIAGTLL